MAHALSLIWHAQKRMALSPKQLAALAQTRRRLLTDIGTLLAEREQLGAMIRVRVRLSLCIGLSGFTELYKS